MRVPWSVLAVASILLSSATVLAQSQPPPGGYKPMTVEVESPEGLFDPLGKGDAVAQIPITVRVDCLEAKSDAEINFTVRDKPEWLWVRSMPGWGTNLGNYTGYKDMPCDQETGYVTITEHMVANFTTEAPAYRFANFTVVVTRATSVVAVRGQMQPGFWGELEVVPPNNVLRVQATETKVEVPFRVRNYGNGATTVTFTYEHPAEVVIDAPDIMILGSNQQGGEWDKPFVVTVFLKGITKDFAIDVTATGVSRNPDDPAAVAAHSASGEVDVRADLVPGPSAALVVVALLGAAVAVVGRRRSE